MKPDDSRPRSRRSKRAAAADRNGQAAEPPPARPVRVDRPPIKIERDAVYGTDELLTHLRQGRKCLAEMRRQGLITFKLGRRRYVRGRDFLEFCDRLVAAQQEEATP